ncbi:MAG TPA: ATP-binding protein [Verrucomicrobiae bacterium]|nr:ATP-binding protein [Verrucomicrobiae bacterium]
MPALVLATGVALTAGAFFGTAALTRHVTTQRFDALVGQIAEAIAARPQSYVRMLQGAQGFWASGAPVDLESWERYVSALELPLNYPAFETVGFTAALELPPAPDALRAAFERARDSGAPSLATLAESGDGVGLALVLPVYAGKPETIESRRAALRGFVHGSIRGDTLMREVLGFRGFYIQFTVHDGEQRVFASDHPPGTRLNLSRTVEFAVAGHPWIARFHAGPMLSPPAERAAPVLAGAIAALVTALVFGLLLMLWRTRERAQQLANSMTADLQQREMQLRELSAQLRQSNEDLQHFAEAASHDLKEPLRSIAGSLGLVAQRYPDELGAARELVKHASFSAEHLAGLIDRVLDYARLQDPLRAMQPVPLDTALNTALLDLKQLIEETGAQVICPAALPLVEGHPGQLARVFQNLIDNAIKYSRRHASTPTVTIAARRAGSEWVISVADNGIGIAPEHHTQLFVMFKRLHGSEYGGHGMGLALCQRIVQRHGGRIWVESRRAAGATFCFTLPARDAPVASAA